MNKYDYISKNKETTSNLANDLSETVNKYGLSLVNIVEDDFEGHIVAHFKLLGE